MSVCREFFFKGTVQGVGFRWTAKRLADRLNVSGWVRNNPDGSVSLVAEGEDIDIEELLSNLNEALGSYISEVTSQSCSSTGDTRGFVIKS